MLTLKICASRNVAKFRSGMIASHHPVAPSGGGSGGGGGGAARAEQSLRSQLFASSNHAELARLVRQTIPHADKTTRPRGGIEALLYEIMTAEFNRPRNHQGDVRTLNDMNLATLMQFATYATSSVASAASSAREAVVPPAASRDEVAPPPSSREKGVAVPPRAAATNDRPTLVRARVPATHNDGGGGGGEVTRSYSHMVDERSAERTSVPPRVDFTTMDVGDINNDDVARMFARAQEEREEAAAAAAAAAADVDAAANVQQPAQAPAPQQQPAQAPVVEVSEQRLLDDAHVRRAVDNDAVAFAKALVVVAEDDNERAEEEAKEGTEKGTDTKETEKETETETDTKGAESKVEYSLNTHAVVVSSRDRLRTALSDETPYSFRVGFNGFMTGDYSYPRYSNHPTECVDEYRAAAGLRGLPIASFVDGVDLGEIVEWDVVPTGEAAHAHLQKAFANVAVFALTYVQVYGSADLLRQQPYLSVVADHFPSEAYCATTPTLSRAIGKVVYDKTPDSHTHLFVPLDNPSIAFETPLARLGSVRLRLEGPNGPLHTPLDRLPVRCLQLLIKRTDGEYHVLGDPSDAATFLDHQNQNFGDNAAAETCLCEGDDTTLADAHDNDQYNKLDRAQLRVRVVLEGYLFLDDDIAANHRVSLHALEWYDATWLTAWSTDRDVPARVTKAREEKRQFEDALAAAKTDCERRDLRSEYVRGLDPLRYPTTPYPAADHPCAPLWEAFAEALCGFHTVRHVCRPYRDSSATQTDVVRAFDIDYPLAELDRFGVSANLPVGLLPDDGGEVGAFWDFATKLRSTRCMNGHFVNHTVQTEVGLQVAERVLATSDELQAANV
jgi:hypothetical protein